MTNHWAIAIGINQYQFFQPLGSAQQDAQALHTLLVESGGFSRDHCLLMTETSPPFLGHSTYPDRENIQNWLTLLTQQWVQAGDVLWCFFSGYGVCVHGQDYLVPIDGNPAALATTMLSLRSILDSLRAAPTENSLLLLDMSHSQSVLENEAVGAQTAALATESQISTILACQPGQFSREVPGLGHGFFTVALLESLRSGQAGTPGNLNRYLSSRLPELSEQYDRPLQQPLTLVTPAEKLNQSILPAIGATRNPLPAQRIPSQPPMNGTPSNSSSSPNGAIPPPNTVAHTPVPLGQSPKARQEESQPSLVKDSEPASTRPSFESRLAALDIQPAQRGDADITHAPLVGQSLPVPSIDSQESEEMEIADAVFWRRVLMVGGTVGLLLALGFFWRNGQMFNGEPSLPQVSHDPTGAVSSPIAAAPTTPAQSDQATSFNAGTTNRTQPLNVATPPGNKVQGNDSNPPATTSSPQLPNLPKPGIGEQPPPTGIGPSPGLEHPPSPTSGASPGKSNPGNTNSVHGNPKSTQKPVNPTSPISKPIAPPVKTVTQTGKSGEAILQEARSLIRFNQASQYNKAIAKAREVPPKDSAYAQAQQEIVHWSQVIFNLSKRRAENAAFAEAIAAAKLVPRDQPLLYAEAQRAIAQWQRRVQRGQGQQSAQVLLLRAQTMIQPGQASSYSRAITSARQVQTNQAEYTEARQFIERWSQAIFDLARSRAAKGSLVQAIQTASLVPADVAAYPSARRAISTWRGQASR
ncbi:MAG: caspase family protein [Scytolyngbya sp. HA4215-MV1]|jgi:hypothetical protein|nr:caspase family protein [Scytolyngbya sp. HA4215-MV1]